MLQRTVLGPKASEVWSRLSWCPSPAICGESRAASGRLVGLFSACLLRFDERKESYGLAHVALELVLGPAVPADARNGVRALARGHGAGRGGAALRRGGRAGGRASAARAAAAAARAGRRGSDRDPVHGAPRTSMGPGGTAGGAATIGRARAAAAGAASAASGRRRAGLVAGVGRLAVRRPGGKERCVAPEGAAATDASLRWPRAAPEQLRAPCCDPERDDSAALTKTRGEPQLGGARAAPRRDSCAPARRPPAPAASQRRAASSSRGLAATGAQRSSPRRAAPAPSSGGAPSR
jgi:hypothetical protein